MIVQKLPFNWAGNKVDYMGYVNNILYGRKYKRAIDIFMGSGNMIMNINVKVDELIGNDIIPLMPLILSYMRDNPQDYKYKEIKEIDDMWGFTCSENYYAFREYWNKRYIAEDIDKQFIYETVMLLKMCNNSLVRFNQKGEFNQGFRGIARNNKIGKFFTDSSLKRIPEELNSLGKKLQKRTYSFYNKDYKELLQNDIHLGKDDLLLLDPPYILTNTSTYGGTYNNESEKELLSFVEGLECDFILFNYLYNIDKEHRGLIELIDRKGYKVISLRTKGKLKSLNEDAKVNEVLITNII